MIAGGGYASTWHSRSMSYCKACPKRRLGVVMTGANSTSNAILRLAPLPTPFSATQKYVPRSSFLIEEIFKTLPLENEMYMNI